LAQLLDIALSDGSLKEHDATCHDSVNAYLELLSAIPVKPGSIKLHNDRTHCWEGIASVAYMFGHF